MNPWILVGFLLNAALGVSLFTVHSFGLFKSTPGLSKLFVKLEYASFLEMGLMLWFAAWLASALGFFMLLFKRREAFAAKLLFWGGLFFFPIGMIQVNGALLLLEQLREQAFKEERGVAMVANSALDTSISRKGSRALFDLGFGLLLALSALCLVLYSNFQNFYRRLPTELPEGLLQATKPGAFSKSYFILGVVLLLSFYVLGLLWVALAAQTSAAVAFKFVSMAFLSGPTAFCAFAFGLCLCLIGLATLRRPILQLHEHYFTMRPGLFSRRFYSLYKDITEIEEAGETQLVLHLPIDGKQKHVPLPIEPSDERRRRQMLNAFTQRRAHQQRYFFAS